MNQQELEKLSTKEIKSLWDQTRNEQRKQMGLREAQSRANADLGVDDEAPYWIDGFGNRIDGEKVEPKTEKTYVDANGYIQYGDKPDEGDGLHSWLQTVDLEHDEEVRNALGPELFFEENLNGVGLIGQLENNGWLVTVKHGDRPDYKFRLARNLTRDQAIAQASDYAKIKMGPQFKDLSDEQIRICQRLACGDRNAAFVYYLQARVPGDLADQFLQLGADGNSLGIQTLAAQEDISAVAEEGVMNAFHWANPRCTEDFFDYVRVNDGDRVWTFALLDSLWNQYQLGNAIHSLDRNEPTTEEVVAAAEAMSDEDLAATLAEARKLRGRSRY